MTFHSILFENPNGNIPRETAEAPDFFADLNLDQIVDAITFGRQEYDLKPFFYSPLHTVDAVRYRQEIMQDLEGEILSGHIRSFATAMRTVRNDLAYVERLYYPYQKKRWFLEAIRAYCDAVVSLAEDMASVDLKSRGLATFRDYLTGYLRSAPFEALQAETQTLLADLSTVKYCLRIKGNGITVRKAGSEIDYSADVEHTFEKFKRGAVKDYLATFISSRDMNHVEARILELVARLYPDVFANLDDYCTRHRGFVDETIGAFDREIQFYVAYLEYISRLKQAGLKFCYPQLSETDKSVRDDEGFDMALASKLIGEGAPVVCNDFYLEGNERLFVVSGPNQGGKTTFARAFGQLHYLASLGCPVPGSAAHLFLCDRLFTHFEKEEDIQNLRGKLQDDLVRIRQILDQATSNSIIIMNEIFTSTTVQDAVFLGTRVMERLMALDLLGVCVTFIDEWASLSEKTVSMVSTVVPENPAQRTYRIVRRPADGRAYAAAIAAKYHLTYEQLRERIEHESSAAISRS